MGRDYFDEPEDPRSTWRKRARKVLLQLVADGERSYHCEYVSESGEVCGWFPGEQSRSDSLDVNHINKILSDLDPSNLEFLCRVHHLLRDRASGKGVTLHGEKDFGIKKDEFYG